MILFSIPQKAINKKIAEYMRNGKPIHKPERMRDEPFSIVSSYQSEYRGLVQYYKMANNLRMLTHVRHVMEVSMVKTLANKYKTSCNKIYRKYKATMKIDNITYKILQVIIPRTGKKPLETHFGAVSLRRNSRAEIKEEKWREWNGRTELVERMLAEKCELCNSEETVDVHHIRKLADIKSKNKKPIADWKLKMVARNRKTLVVCKKCHQKIHNGEHDGRSLKRNITTGEPREFESLMRGSERGSWKSN